MTPTELKIVEREIESIYRLWHACGLKVAERGIPKGTLCDSCKQDIAAHMARIKEKQKEPA
jgi:hypothetical protein